MNTARQRPLQILVLSSFTPGDASVIEDFLFSFRNYSRHRYYYVFNPGILGEAPDLSRFDVILIFWSLYLLGPGLATSVKEKIRQADALKVLFRQDEYDSVRPFNAVMAELGAQVMCTCVPEEDHETFYPRALVPSLRAVYTVLTGYLPASLERVPLRPRVGRPVDIGYRSRVMPYYLGDLAREKWVLADRFGRIGPAHGFRCDISVREEDRLYGRQWVEFLNASRFALGSPSGASVVDFSGEIRRQTEAYLRAHPDASYAEARRRFFADVDGKVVIDTTSPRIFEAAACGSVLVLHEGRYGGLLVPDRHYIPVRKDYGNIDEVVRRMRDEALCEELAANAHRDLVASGRYGYRAFGRWFDGMLTRHADGGTRRPRRFATAFYAKNYLHGDERIVPFGSGFVVLPSRRLRWTIVRRLGPVVGFLIEDPVNFFEKGTLAAWICLTSRPARRLILGYLRDRTLRGTLRLHRLVEDLLKLRVVEEARRGRLRSRERFEVSATFDRA
ncbi:MAG: glycosyltransferase, partial [Candidatus Rokuibacteriota bacterium]